MSNSRSSARSVPGKPITTSGQKVVNLHLEDLVISLRAKGTSIKRIRELCNEELKKSDEYKRCLRIRGHPLPKVNDHDIGDYLNRNKIIIEKALADERENTIATMIREFEERSTIVRKDLSVKIASLVEKELESGKATRRVFDKENKCWDTIEVEMSTRDKKDVAEILMQLLKIQESAERVLGIGKDDNKNTNVNINLFYDRVKNNIDKRRKSDDYDDFVDVNYQDVNDDIDNDEEDNNITQDEEE
jgi:hypothetical protein